MWRLTSSFFIGMLTTAMFTNAVAVYLLHDVDADRMGRLNLAYWELAEEFLMFAVIVAALFLLFAWIGNLVFRLRDTSPNFRLGLLLGVGVILIQYPAEFMVRRVTGRPADTFLLGYLLLSPVLCAAINLLNGYRHRTTS